LFGVAKIWRFCRCSDRGSRRSFLRRVADTRCRSHRRAVGWNHHDDLRIFIDPGVASRPRAISLRQRPLLGEHRLSSTSSLHPQSL
jgi:hypothetical protein